MLKSVLIIGAGISGIAAANFLQKQNIQVTVLEGRDRLGGRIYTDRTLGYPVDLGASWIHGIKKNPIGKLAKQYHLPLVKTDYDNLVIYDRNGNKIREKDIWKSWKHFAKAIARVKRKAERLESDLSIARAWEKFAQVEENNEKQNEFNDLIHWCRASELLVETGMDLERLSCWYWDEDEDFAGADYLFREGYDRIVAQLSENLDIRYQQTVTEMAIVEDGVTVTTETDNFKGTEAIVTLPLGVLKAGTVKFSPELPPTKREAIARLEMGTLNKIVLQFPETFWEGDRDLIGYLNRENSAFWEFFNGQKCSGRPVLIALTAGKAARELETQSDREIVSQAIATLRRMFGPAVPEPENARVTRWSRDRFSWGSYSQIPVGGTIEDRDRLADAVGSRLFFAGEATSRDYPGTVHGAYLSGLRAARELAEAIAAHK
ncbi:FAD-dependent oxidoreductase [Oxynema sp. CENA135]|uniref:FAD-dependent oxidoreductase n=1 Tax=Oxynema sp. CENA135 TaxID=984206 RepID=UPI001F18F818|nr:FAD-dependent oxidoreductase [Oxynema sp. CENA135]